MSNTEKTSMDKCCNVSFFKSNCSIRKAVAKLSTTSEAEDRGAVYTRFEVVEFILDLIGYKPDKRLFEARVLEPSFGNGCFLLQIVDRLIVSWRNHQNSTSSPVEALKDSVRAVELHLETFYKTKKVIVKKLIGHGISNRDANQLVEAWLIQGDFLLEEKVEPYEYIVGNPPYLRQEAIPAPLLQEYRLRYKTMFDRADIYIAFMERSLSLLALGGKLGFICSDRWMKNRYGGPLRNYISKDYNLQIYVDMVGTNAFHNEVSAYPAITVISREPQGVIKVAHKPKIDKKALALLSAQLTSINPLTLCSVEEVRGVINGFEPWLIESSQQLKLLRKIELAYPTLEEVGCKVGIGVATGADKVFIQDYEKLDVEKERKLKLVTTKDVKSGKVVWSGQGVINTFDEKGTVVDLSSYPRLERFLEDNSHVIKGRHIAKKHPNNWFRTIDRIRPELLFKPKLLIPDIKGEAHVVYEPGDLYPHHNLYYVTSETWDLKALQAILLSNISKFFISIYSTKMRGGYLRFQAQYLRRIRVPLWKNVSKELRIKLINAAERRDIDKCNKVVFDLYKLNQKERNILEGIDK